MSSKALETRRTDIIDILFDLQMYLLFKLSSGAYCV